MFFKKAQMSKDRFEFEFNNQKSIFWKKDAHSKNLYTSQFFSYGDNIV